MTERRYPVGIQTFERIIENGSLNIKLKMYLSLRQTQNNIVKCKKNKRIKHLL